MVKLEEKQVLRDGCGEKPYESFLEDEVKHRVVSWSCLPAGHDNKIFPCVFHHGLLQKQHTEARRTSCSFPAGSVWLLEGQLWAHRQFQGNPCPA